MKTRRAALSLVAIAVLASAVYASVVRQVLNKALPKPLPVVQKLLDRVAAPDMGPDAAFDICNTALKLARDLHDECGESRVNNFLGQYWQLKGQMDRAALSYDSALHIQERIGDLAGEADSLLYLAVADNILGKETDAAKLLIRAVSLYQRLKDPTGEASSLLELGEINHRRGRDANALQQMRSAEALAVKGKATGVRVQALSQISNLLLSMGQTSKGAATALKATTLFDKDTLPIDESAAFELVATAYRNLGRTREALPFFDKALALARSIPDAGREAIILSETGAAETKVGRYSSALKHLETAYASFRKMHAPLFEAGALQWLGDLYAAMGLDDKAVQWFLHAAEAWRRGGNRREEALALEWIAQIDLKAGRRDAAIWRLKLAVNLSQTVRAGLIGLDKKTRDTYRDTIAAAYRLLADALIKEGRLGEAEQVIGLLKDEEYYRLLRAAGTGTDVDLTPVERTWSAKYDSVMAQAVVAEQELEKEESKAGKADQSKLAALRGQLQDSNDAVSAFLKNVQSAFESLGVNTDRIADVRSSKDIVTFLHQRELRKYHPAAAYTLLTKDGVQIILSLPDTRIVSTIGPKINAQTLNRMIVDFRLALGDPTRDPKKLGSQLYDVLVRPIEKVLRDTNTQTVLWSLDGPLRYIPIWALYDSRTDKYLIEKFPSAVFLPSTIGLLERKQSSDWAGAVFVSSKACAIGGVSFPALVNGQQEADTVRRLSHSRLYPGAQFTAPNLMREMNDDTGVLHIVSHFRFYAADQEQSYLVLGNGKALTMAEFYRDFPRTEVQLLVLSACETAVGGDADGSEFEGLARLAQEKGAGAVIATLWPVNDKATSVLMAAFYRLHAGHPEMAKLDILRTVQLQMLHGSSASGSPGGPRRSVSSNAPDGTGSFKRDPRRPYAHPFYWAPFVLFGNWR